jgi:hypothetical protein
VLVGLICMVVGIWIGLVRSLPGREADLDFELGALEWRALFRLVSGAQFGKRRLAIYHLGRFF